MIERSGLFAAIALLAAGADQPGFYVRDKALALASGFPAGSALAGIGGL